MGNLHVCTVLQCCKNAKINFSDFFVIWGYLKINDTQFACVSIHPIHKMKLDLQSAGSSPNLTYTKSSARDAIRIPWWGWIWTPPLDSELDTFFKFLKVLGLRVEELGTPHWHPMVLGYSASKTEGGFINFFLNLQFYLMSLLLLSTRTSVLAGWIKGAILGTRLFSF